MARIAFEQVAIIGTGLIGASFGLALKRLTPAPRVIGCDLTGSARRSATGLKAVDRATGNLADAVREADLVVIAVPVRAIELVLREIGPLLRPGTVVTDTGSTKRQVMAWAAELLPDGVSFVGGHPMTGRATAGTEGASGALFENAVYCVSPSTTADPKGVENVVKTIESLGSVVYFVEPDEHDGLVASISHLPFVASNAIMRSAATDRGWREARTIAAGGFATITHLCENDSRMFADVCLTNRDQVTRQIDRLVEELGELRALIQAGDDGIYDRFAEAQRLHQDWLAGRGNEPAPSVPAEDLKPQSLFFPGRLGEMLRRGERDKT